MKTKLLFTALFLMVFAESAYCQNYIPMLNSSWNIAEANFGGTTSYIIEPGVDVIIGGLSYKKFMDQTVEVYLREDVTTRKVYRRVNNTDQLLYDFSLTNDSTITLSNGTTYTVTVSTINVVGGTRKKIYLYHDFFPSETWIEGVGNSQNPMKPSYELFSDPYFYLTCSSVDNVNVYNFALANGQTNPTDCSMLLGIEELNLINKINFYPNPFKSILTISTESFLEHASLKIFNSIGQLVSENRNINGQQYSFYRDNLKSGIYFAQLFQDEKLIANQKLIITD